MFTRSAHSRATSRGLAPRPAASPQSLNRHRNSARNSAPHRLPTKGTDLLWSPRRRLSMSRSSALPPVPLIKPMPTLFIFREQIRFSVSNQTPAGGSTAPGFIMPSGSNASLIARIIASFTGSPKRCKSPTFRRPMPCSALTDPPI